MVDRNTAAAYASSFGISALSITVNEFVAVAGLVLAFATFVVNWRYRHLHYRLAARENKEINLEPAD